MNSGASLTVRTTDGRLPIDAAAKDTIKQLIRDEQKRREDLGRKRAVNPNLDAVEQALSKGPRMDVPRYCCCCDKDIAMTKAVLLSCECKHAFCLACAHIQLFETMREEVIGIGDVSVACPNCKQRPVVSKEGKGSNLVTASVFAAKSAEQALVRCIHVLCVLCC